MNKFKSNKGITGVDIVISIGVISITLSILVSMYLSLNITNMEIERKTQAISYATQIIEKVSELYYEDVNTENFSLNNETRQIAGIKLAKGYIANVKIEPYIPENSSIDVVKKVEVTIKYKKVFDKEDYKESVTLSVYKTKETLIIPNAPELGENFVAIRSYTTNGTTTYKVTNSTDSQWYSYQKKKWALAVVKEKINDTIKEEDLYVWIPRYAYKVDSNNNINIQFLYSDKDKTVDKLGNLQSTDYIIDSSFTGSSAKGYWVQLSQIDLNETAKRLNDSIYGKLIY